MGIVTVLMLLMKTRRIVALYSTMTNRDAAGNMIQKYISQQSHLTVHNQYCYVLGTPLVCNNNVLGYLE